MELNMKVLVKVAVMLFLLGITATVEARSDARSFIKEVVPKADTNYYSVKSTTYGDGFCTLPWPIYFCNFPGEHCYAGCSGRCLCWINEAEGTVDCKCVADEETKLLFPGAGVSKFQ